MLFFLFDTRSGKTKLIFMKTIRLLTIGNRFANNAQTYLQDLAADTSDVSFEIGKLFPGKYTNQKEGLIKP